MLMRRDFLKAMGLVSAGALVAPGFWSRPAAAQQMMEGMLGHITILPRGPVTLHTYTGSDALAGHVTTHVIETANQLVVVDGQLALSTAAEAAAYIESLGKPVERIILSHEHPDHWVGAANLPPAPFVATEAAAAGVQGWIANGILDTIAANYGEDVVPSEARVPEVGVTVGEETIDGVTFIFDTFTNTEAPEIVTIRLPEAGTAIVQDLMFNNVHFFPGLDRDNWIATLEQFKTWEGLDTLLVGHGLPTTWGELDVAIGYLKLVQASVAEAESADDIINALTAAYPTYDGLGLMAFWPQFFQPS